jgi:hypothetical protein
VSTSWALQQAIVTRLRADVTVAGMVAARVFDRPQAEIAFPNITIGASDTVLSEAGCFSLHIETVQVDVWSREMDGKRECKVLTDAVVKALHQQDAAMAVGALALMRVVLVRMLDDPDGRTSHGIVQVECTLEVEP